MICKLEYVEVMQISRGCRPLHKDLKQIKLTWGVTEKLKILCVL